MNDADPHAQGELLYSGASLEKAEGALILIHGRGATAEGILSLADELNVEGFANLAPQAAGNSWYPQSFLAPLEFNQPYLDSALGRLGSIVSDLTGRGISSERIALLGFSQGACLVTEFVGRNPQHYGAVLALSGGLIGPPGAPRSYAGSLQNTPAFLGSSDPDAHVPFSRVEETAAVFRRMGAAVDIRRYPGMAHSINGDEIEACRNLLLRIQSV